MNIKNRIKVVIICTLFAMCCASMTACSIMDEPSSAPELKYSTQYPQSAVEYNLLINEKIMPFLNVAEGHATKGKDVISNVYPVDEELISVEDSLNYLNEIYASCKVIMPPESEKQRHSDTLMQMQRVINSIEVYSEYLQKAKDESLDKYTEDISGCVKIMVSECTSLTNMFNLIA